MRLETMINYDDYIITYMIKILNLKVFWLYVKLHKNVD